MKLVAVVLLVVGMLSNSTLALAEGPVPLSALMRNAGTPPAIPPLTDDQSTDASTQPPHATHMTTGGKIMTGVGIGMLVIGVAVIGGTTIAAVGGFRNTAKVDAGFATGGGLFAGGVTLIVFGSHRRSAK